MPAAKTSSLRDPDEATQAGTGFFIAELPIRDSSLQLSSSLQQQNSKLR